MINPNQNTIQMSSRQKTSYVVTADKDYTNWKKKIDNLLGRLKSDRKIDKMTDKIEAFKAEIKKNKVEAEKNLKILNNTASEEWHGSKASFEEALEKIKASFNGMQNDTYKS